MALINNPTKSYLYNFIIKEKNILLEICPTSNVDTKVVTELKYHPIKKLVDAGVLVTINTDNRTVSNTNLDKEYDLLRKEFNFNDDDLKIIFSEKQIPKWASW